MDRILHQTALPVENAEINAPGIHTDTVCHVILTGLPDTGFQLEKQPEEIPVHGIKKPYRVIGKPMYLAKFYFFSVVAARHHPAA